MGLAAGAAATGAGGGTEMVALAEAGGAVAAAGGAGTGAGGFPRCFFKNKPAPNTNRVITISAKMNFGLMVFILDVQNRQKNQDRQCLSWFEGSNPV
jgi:hypothetical protein